jgi:DNA-binding NtrC family response regulator
MPTIVPAAVSEYVHDAMDGAWGDSHAPARSLSARVLLVTDQATTGRVLAARLRARGAEVLTVGSHHEAIERLGTCRLRGRSIDLVVAHVHRGDAYQLVCLAMMRSMVPLVAVGPEPLAAACLGAGCSDFCQMPIDLDEFLASCASALRCASV